MKATHTPLITLLLAISAAQMLPAPADERIAPAQVVATFNAAVTARDMDTAMAQLAEGGVQFQLRAAHPGMSDNPPLTAGLEPMWKTVGAILFPTTDSYERKTEVIDARTDGEVATVWTNTTTITQRKNVEEPMVLNFTELYLLVLKDGRWQIAAMIDNRQPDSIRVDEGMAAVD